MEDENHVWLSISSGSCSVEEISEATKIPLPQPNSLGKSPKRNKLSIYSDKHVSTKEPLQKHLDWMLDFVESQGRLLEFLSAEGNASNLHLYVQTQSDQVYFEVSSVALRRITEIGCSLSTKFETYK